MPPGCIKIVVYALKLMHSSAKSKIVSRWVHQYSESKLHRNLGCSVEESNCDVNKKSEINHIETYAHKYGTQDQQTKRW
jgi:hypothetical protein